MNNDNLKVKIPKEEDWRVIDSLQKDLNSGEIILVASDSKVASNLLYGIVKKGLHWNSPVDNVLDDDNEILTTAQMMKSALIGSGVYSIIANELSPQGILNHVEMLLNDDFPEEKVIEVVTIRENNGLYLIEDVFTLPS